VSADLAPVSLNTQPGSLDAASSQLPGGAYTTFRTYQRCQALRLDDHFQRLEQTAHLAGQPVSLAWPCLRSALHALANCAPPDADQRFRVTLDLERQPGEIYIMAEPLHVPSTAEYEQGVLAITCDLQRRLPEAKLTRFIERAGEVRRSLPVGVNEAIMVDADGYLREGLSSNFFAVRAGTLWTAAEGVLAGITRATVLDCAAQLGVSVRLEAVRLADLAALDEAFITSASRGVLPLRRIDAIGLRLTAPGPFTRRMMQAFDQAIAAEIEPI
jgi:branched-chain amino acid aminotransferase